MTFDPHAALVRARASIAHALLAPDEGVEPTLGDVTLHAHQRDAIARLRRIMASHGGALLADEAGLGKTYVALALAREAERPLLVVPAALRSTWREAMRRAGVTVPAITHESLSRAHEEPHEAHDLVVVDEAHHARTRETRRWRALAGRTRGARVLLLTATPLHNDRRELETLLSLFLGARAHDAPDALLARCIVRRERDDAAVARDAPAIPRVMPARLLTLSHDDAILDALAELPPPLGDVDDAGTAALLVLGLVRQWASSEGALRAALTRRLARAEGLEAALDEGCLPSRQELARWAVADDAVQLPFAALLAPPEPRAPALREAVGRHATAVRAVLARLDAGIDRDRERAERMLWLRERHAGARVVAFASFAGTIRALWRTLRRHPGVAALTSAGGAVAGGPVSREHVLRHFAPEAHGAGALPAHEAVTLLLTTDLASEGVNLQDASVVVHLDMPWTPARLEQRVGRVARLGARHDVVHVYAMAPPSSSERVLALERRLRAKLGAAARTVGVAGAIVPTLAVAPEPQEEALTASAPRLAESARARIATWAPAAEPDESPVVAAIAHDGVTGALACWRVDGEPRLVALVDERVSGDGEGVLRAVRAVDEGEGVAVDAGALRRARRHMEAWLQAQRGASAAGVEELGAAALLRRVATETVSAVARAPRHRRAQVAQAAAQRADAGVLARGARRGGSEPDALLALVLLLPTR